MNPLQVILALLTMAAGALPTVSVSFRSVAPRSSRQIRMPDTDAAREGHPGGILLAGCVVRVEPATGSANLALSTALMII